MSTKLSSWWARGAKARHVVHPTTVKAVAAPGGTSIREKMIIAGVVAVLAILYAKGVTLMVDAADTPSPYTTFLYRAD